MNPLPVPRRLTDFSDDALALAPRLLGKFLCRRLADGTVLRRRITETEAYFGEEDTACHAHKGRTPRTDVMYSPGGCAYVYLCYGMHEMLNVVTGREGRPEAVLIRGVEGAEGPGRLTKALHVDRSRVLVCGNPEMTGELRQALTARGFATNRRGVPGQMAFEKYW